ncbi:ADAM 17-like protease isoform X1 [Centruroides vittatus]|uniref:ADAM 17-like protease isoform X1 n=2 Tax=Centruroides vittatus TaxID=120091 RepID=UPI0035105C0F
MWNLRNSFMLCIIFSFMNMKKSEPSTDKQRIKIQFAFSHNDSIYQGYEKLKEKPEKLMMNFQAFNINFHIKAERMKTIHDDVTIEIYDYKTINITKLSEFDANVFSGFLVGVKNSKMFCVLNNYNFKGMIFATDAYYGLSPDYDGVHTIISRINIQNKYNVLNHNKLAQRVIMEDSEICTMSLIATPSLFREYNGNEADLINWLVFITEMLNHGINFIKGFFPVTRDHRQIMQDFRFQLKEIKIFKNENSVGYSIQNESNAKAFLKDASNYKNNVCWVHFISGVSLQGTQQGISYFGVHPDEGICMNSERQDVPKNIGITSTWIGPYRLSTAHFMFYFSRELYRGFGVPYHFDLIEDCKTSVRFQSSVLMRFREFQYIRKQVLEYKLDCFWDSISGGVHRKGKLCFINKTISPSCGNGILEQNEDCDCGTKEECELNDPNCAPPGDTDDRPCTIRRSKGKLCSPQSSPCCTDDGKIVPRSERKLCSYTIEDCRKGLICNGQTDECGEARDEEDGNGCAYHTRVCLEGTCLNSVCVYNKLADCLCKEEKYACHVCCEKRKKCKPISFFSNISLPRKYEIKRIWFEACLSNKGFCNNVGNCEMIFHDGYFPYKSNAEIFFVLFCLVLVITCIIAAIFWTIFNRKYFVNQFYRECRTKETEFNDQLFIKRQFKNTFFRLTTLFPTVSPPIILELIRHLGEEYYVVITLINNSVPIKTKFIQKFENMALTNYSLVDDVPTLNLFSDIEDDRLNKCLSFKLLIAKEAKKRPRHSNKLKSRTSNKLREKHASRKRKKPSIVSSKNKTMRESSAKLKSSLEFSEQITGKKKEGNE